MNYILDEHGEPKAEPDVVTWAKWFESAKRKLAHDEVGSARISTVFLGIDRNMGGAGPPVLYETMVFGGDLDQEEERYCTRDEALKGHADMVERVQAI